MAQPIPRLPASLYLQYKREGNRSHYEGPYFERRSRLHRLVMAECLEHKGRFLDAIGDTLWAICEESTWCLPAHVGMQKAGVGLPDTTEPIVDLFAAETGASIAWSYYLLGPELDKFSPRLRPRLVREVEHRILTPVFARNDFWWMGFRSRSRGDRPNNWNPWINSNVLAASLLLEPDPDRRVQLVAKCLRSLDRFLEPYPSDGSCDEGPGYWGHAGGSLLDCLDLLHSATNGRLDMFQVPLIQEIGRFIYRVHICGDWFVPVGDCPARFGLERALVFRYGRDIEDSRLESLAAFHATAEDVLDSAGTHYFGRALFALFTLRDLLAFPSKGPPLVRDVWLGSPDMQLMTARSEDGNCRGWFLAAWGAHNGQSHNHNDVGNIVVFLDGHPLLIDVGAPTYTAQTFSSRRYELWPMQSAFHNLPTINGVMQAAGRQYAAREVAYSSDDAVAQLQLDIAPAYPKAAQVRSWVRTARLVRGREIELTDAFKLVRRTGPTTENFMTPCSVTTDTPGRLTFSASEKGRGAVLEFDPQALSPEVETIPLKDGRLHGVWGDHLTRIRLQLKTRTLEGALNLRIQTQP